MSWCIIARPIYHKGLHTEKVNKHTVFVSDMHHPSYTCTFFCKTLLRDFRGYLVSGQCHCHAVPQ